MSGLGSSHDTQRGERRRVRLSLAFALGALFGSLMLAGLGTELYFQWRSGQEAVVSLLGRVALRSMQLLENEFKSHLQPADDLLAGLVEVLDEEPEGEAIEEVEAFLRGALMASPRVERIVVIDRKGELLSFSRSEGFSADRSANALIDRPASEEALEPDKLRLRLVGGLLWMDLIAQTGDRIAVATPIDTLSERAAEIAASSNGEPFLLLGEDRVLAHPSLAGEPELEVENLPRTSQIAGSLLSIYTKSEPVEIAVRTGLEGIEVTAAESEGIEATFLTLPVGMIGKEPVILGAAVPPGGALASLERVRGAALAGLGLLLVSLIAAVLLARRIARPINDLARTSRRIARLELKGLPPRRASRIEELNELAEAQEAMLAGLRSFEKYVPQRLVKRLLETRASTDVASEQRELAIMFTDIVGFSSLAETMSPEAVAAFLNEHFALLERCVEASGGTIDKYIGDALMAFWGAPEPLDDSALRACQAAIGIARALEQDNRRRQAEGLAPVRLRIGIHSGPMVVGNIGGRERVNYTVVGDTVNACQRLEALGKDWDSGGAATILVSEEIARSTGDEVRFTPVGDLPLRGRAKPMAVYRLETSGELPAGSDAEAGAPQSGSA